MLGWEDQIDTVRGREKRERIQIKATKIKGHLGDHTET